MKKTQRRVACVAGAIVLGLGLASCSAGTENGTGDATEAPVKIALVTSVTGPYQPLGEGNVQGATVAVNQANAEGGIDGRKIELVVLDDKTVADQAVVNVNSALGDDDVLAILGTPDSNGAVAAAPIASRAGISYVSLSSNDTLPAEIDPYIFNVPPSTEGWTNPLLEYMQDNDMKTLAVAYASDDVYAEGGWKNTVSAASDYGIEIVVDEAFKTADTEFSGIIQKVRVAAPDAFLFWGTGAAPVIITKAFADAGLPTQLVLTGAQASSLWSDAAGAQAEGVILNGYNAVIGDFLPESETKTQYDRLAAGLQEDFGTDVAQFTSDAYAGAWLVIDAMRNAEDLSRDGVRDALEETSTVTSNGVYEWSSKSHNNTDPSNIAVFTVKDGVFVPTQWQEERFANIR